VTTRSIDPSCRAVAAITAPGVDRPSATGTSPANPRSSPAAMLPA
jgi:hypothetical protein